ncbi:MAG: sigma-70 family RNA polymerase sigma factor [Thermomicrobiales bacterium]
MATLPHARTRTSVIAAPPVDSRSDAELVALAKADLRAFALLYARYVDPVHRYCYRRLGNREAAEDATSLVFMKALAAFARFHDTSFRAWLFTIAHNVVTDRYRAAPADQPLEWAFGLTDPAPSPEDHALAADHRRDLSLLLTQLPEHQRQVVELRLAGLSGAEIAGVMGRSPANVNVTQSRAKARLRELLNSRSGTQGEHHGDNH